MYRRNWLEEMDQIGRRGGGGGGSGCCNSNNDDRRNKRENKKGKNENKRIIMITRAKEILRRIRQNEGGRSWRSPYYKDLSRILAVFWLILSVGSSVAVMAYQNDLSAVSLNSRESDGGGGVFSSSSSSSSSNMLGCVWSRTDSITNRNSNGASVILNNGNNNGQQSSSMYAPGNNPFQQRQQHQTFPSSSLSSSSSGVSPYYSSSLVASSSSSAFPSERGSGGMLTLSCNVRTLNQDFSNYTSATSFTREQVEQARVARVKCSDKIFFQSFLLQNQTLFQLRNLRELEIDSCKIRKVPKAVFSSWRYLKKLNIHTNNFQWAPSVGLELETGVFQGLESLEELDLSRSNIWTLFPDPNVLCPMRNLVKLNVSGNRLTDIDDFGMENGVGGDTAPSIFTPGSDAGNKEGNYYCALSIQTLDLSFNSLRRIGRLGRLRRLVELRLQHNLLEELDDGAFAGLTQMQTLDLSSNRLVALAPSIFSPGAGGGPGNLKEILLSNNSISALSPQLFQGLDQLLLLDLSRNFLQDLSSDQIFSGLIRLVVLKLSFNQLRSIPSQMFHDLTSLQALYLDNNNIEVIEPEAFSTLRNLNTIDLSHNKLSRIDARYFSNLYVLKQLFLDHNEIRHMDAESLKNCTSLEDLGLSKNELIQVPVSIRGLGQLKSLDLGENRITSVSNESFTGLSQIYGLRLVDNRISDLPSGFCESMKNLRVLNVAQNRINQISSRAFLSCPEVRALRLDANLLEEIPLTLTDQLPSLLWLNVSDNNRLKWVDYRLLPSTLEWLDVSHNQIESLTKPDNLPIQFQFLQQRGSARRSNNNYNKSSTPTTFNLRVLDASYNKLTSLDHTHIPTLLDTLRLNHNQLSYIAPDTFNRGATRLRRVELIGNKIESLPLSSIRFSQIPKGRNIEMYLGDNPFLCECSMEWLTRVSQLQVLRQYPRIVDLNAIVCRPTFPRSSSAITTTQSKNNSNGSSTSLSSSSSSNQVVIPLLEARAKDFLCPYTSHCFALCHCCEFEFCDCQNFCPDNCTCYHDSSWSSNIVECSNLQYTQVPPRIPMDATEIYLDGNLFGNELSSHIFIGKKNLRALFLNNSQIESIKNKTFNGLKSLEILHLENNLLQDIQGYEFSDVTGLKELYLQNNLIRFISPNTFSGLTFLSVLRLDGNFIIDFSVWKLTGNSYLHSVMLSGNPWSCDCSFLIPFKQWVASSKNTIVVDFALAKCQKEVEDSGSNNSSTAIMSPGGNTNNGTTTPATAILINSLCSTNENPSILNNRISSMGGVTAPNVNFVSHLSGPYHHAHLENSKAGNYGQEFPQNENNNNIPTTGERGGRRSSNDVDDDNDDSNISGNTTFLICLATFIAIIMVATSALLVGIVTFRRKRGLAASSSSASVSPMSWLLCCVSKCGFSEIPSKCLSAQTSSSSSTPNEGDGSESINGDMGPYDYSDSEKLFDAYFIYSKKDEDFVTEKLTGELERGAIQHHQQHYYSPKLRLCLHYRDLCLAPDNPWSSEVILTTGNASKRVVLVVTENLMTEFGGSLLSIIKEHWRKLVVVKLAKHCDDILSEPQLQQRFQLQKNNKSNNSSNNSSSFPAKLEWADKNFWPKFKLLLPSISKIESIPLSSGGNNNRNDLMTISSTTSQHLPYATHLNPNGMNFLNAAMISSQMNQHHYHQPNEPVTLPQQNQQNFIAMMNWNEQQGFPLSHLSSVHPVPSQITPQHFGHVGGTYQNHGNIGQTIFFSQQPQQQHHHHQNIQPLHFIPSNNIRASMRRQQHHPQNGHDNHAHSNSNPHQHIHSTSQLSTMPSSKSPVEANYSSSAVSSEFDHVYSTLDLESPCSDPGQFVGGMLNGAQVGHQIQHSTSSSGISSDGSGTSGASGSMGAPPMYFV